MLALAAALTGCFDDPPAASDDAGFKPDDVKALEVGEPADVPVVGPMDAALDVADVPVDTGCSSDDAGPRAPVLVTSVLFGVFHLYVSPGFALITFVVSALFGLFYERRRTLVGVTAVHAALGLASVAVGLN